MCSLPVVASLVSYAALLSGLLGIVGSLLFVVPTWTGASVREEMLHLDRLRTRLVEPELISPVVLQAIGRSLALLRAEQYWVRAGALCLLAAFVLLSLDATCKG